MSYLLDVSTVVALLWERHVHHQRVRQWFEGVEHAVVCPITELGWLRIATSPAFNLSMSDARQVLLDFRKRAGFVPCDLPLLESRPAPGSKQTTDWYLASLAERNGMKWATLDGASQHPAAWIVPEKPMAT